MPEKREDAGVLRSTPSRAPTGSVEERRRAEDPRSGRPGFGSPADSDELMEDLAAAQQAVEEYEARGIEGTIPYTQYRSQRIGTKPWVRRQDNLSR